MLWAWPSKCDFKLIFCTTFSLLFTLMPLILFSFILWSLLFSYCNLIRLVMHALFPDVYAYWLLFCHYRLTTFKYYDFVDEGFLFKFLYRHRKFHATTYFRWHWPLLLQVVMSLKPSSSLSGRKLSQRPLKNYDYTWCKNLQGKVSGKHVPFIMLNCWHSRNQ